MASEATKERLLRNKTTISKVDFKAYMRTILNNLDGKYGNMYLLIQNSDRIAEYSVTPYTLGFLSTETQGYTVEISKLKKNLNLLKKAKRGVCVIIVTDGGKRKGIVRNLRE